MPILSDAVQQNEMLGRTFLYGPAKTKKTWWVGTAAEAGYNVLLLNGDDGAHILGRLTPAAQRRVRIINCYDQLGSAIMYDFVARFLRGDIVVWDDVTNRCISKINPEHNCFVLDAKKLTANDLVGLDSWTALCFSFTLQAAVEKNIDLSIGERGDNPWELYGDTGRQLDWCLNRLKGLPCNLAVIGHEEMYEKTKTRKVGNKNETEVIFTRRQAISSSRPHAMRLAKYFSDVLWFKMIGNQFRIDASAEADRDGGSRILEPKNYNWDELPYGAYAKLAYIKPPIPDAEMPGCMFVPAGSEVKTEYQKGTDALVVQHRDDVVLQAKPAKPGLLNLIKKG